MIDGSLLATQIILVVCWMDKGWITRHDCRATEVFIARVDANKMQPQPHQTLKVAQRYEKINTTPRFKSYGFTLVCRGRPAPRNRSDVVAA
jgi:hypothetical protein